MKEAALGDGPAGPGLPYFAACNRARPNGPAVHGRFRVLDGELPPSVRLQPGLQALASGASEEDARGLPKLRRFGQEQGTGRHGGGVLFCLPLFPRSKTSTK